MKTEELKNTRFDELARPLIEYMKNNHHPHTVMIVDNKSAEIFEGIKVVSNLNE